MGNTCTLHIASEMRQECEADLFVWDMATGMDPLVNIGALDRSRNFFLVDRTQISTLGESLTLPDAAILLKPVTKAALVAFFFNACRLSKEAAQVTSDCRIRSLRADRDELLQCLIQTNLKLQEYDHDRTNFLARAIHDFRTPLTSITGYCGLLLGDDIGTLNAQQRELLERMHRSAKKLSRMASAMFQLSIAPRAEIALDLQHGELRDCIHKALNEILPAADDKRISIAVDLAPPTGPLMLDASKLEQVLLNLLENACKFTPRFGTIRVKGYGCFWERRRSGLTGSASAADRRRGDDRSPNSYRVDVIDSGSGIPETHLTSVFEEYTSYAGGADRSGGGLGLAICRMIISQHNGKIWAESTSEGATFSFVLPVQKHHGAMSESEPALTRAVV